jgi:broad specificity phosphatase PhoE
MRCQSISLVLKMLLLYSISTTALRPMPRSFHIHTRFVLRMTSTDSTATAMTSLAPIATPTSTSTSTSGPSIKDKRIIFVRHGTTEMNERMKEMPWFSPKFVDAGLWDTRLSEKGTVQAKEVHQNLSNGNGNEKYNLSKVEALIASPLTRTMQTAELIFSHTQQLLPDIPRICQPLLRERLYLSSEVGRPKSELKSDFQNWDLSALPDDDSAWWYTHPDAELRKAKAKDRGSSYTYVSTTRKVRRDKRGFEEGTDIDTLREMVSDLAGTSPKNPYVEWRPVGKYCVEGEPRGEFVARMGALREWLAARPESCIAVVAHWGKKALCYMLYAICYMLYAML